MGQNVATDFVPADVLAAIRDPRYSNEFVGKVVRGWIGQLDELTPPFEPLRRGRTE
jgi:hypothetical protein